MLSMIDVPPGPGSFIEVQKILPLLTDPEQDVAFDVVAPSIPNFGFSEGPSKPGFGITQYAECLDKLMLKLGYNKYGRWYSTVQQLLSALLISLSDTGGRLGLLHHPLHRRSVSRTLPSISLELHLGQKANFAQASLAVPPVSAPKDSSREGRHRALGVVLPPRDRLQPGTEHPSSNDWPGPRGVPGSAPGLDLREASRLDRQLSLDGRRDPHLDLHLLLLRRGPGRQRAHLLRDHSSQRLAPHRVPAAGKAGAVVLPEGPAGVAELLW